MPSFYCLGCKEFRDFDDLFKDFDNLGFCSECHCNIKGERIFTGARPTDCAPTCTNVSLCEDECVGYVVKEN